MKIAAEKDSEKLLYIESLRIIAIFWVIFNHTGNCGFFLFSEREPNSLTFWLYMVLSVVCKIAVPIFFMIAGALLLGRREESLKEIWRKRILKIVCILVVYSLLYYSWNVYSELDTWGIGLFLRQLYYQGTSVHLWYLYAYIGFLIGLPFLRTLVQNLEDKHFFYLIGIALVFRAVLPVAEYLLWHSAQGINSNIGMNWLVGDVILYPCVGYYLHHRLDKGKIQRMLPFLWLISALGTMLSCFMTYYRSEITGVLNETESQAFLASFVLISSICVYLTVMHVMEQKEIPAIAAKLVNSMGSCVFGIYLLHPLLYSLLEKIFMGLVDLGINGMLSSLSACFCIMIVCYWLVLMVKKIPLINKVV